MLKRALHIVSLAALTVVLLASCEKAFIRNGDESATAVFEYLWNRVDSQYSLFDVKAVDWDSIHEVYRQKVTDGMSDDSLFRVLATMLNTLNDGHVNLIAPFDISRSEEIFLQTYGRRNIEPNIVMLNYLGPNYHSAGGFAYNGLRGDSVVYIRYSSFSNSAATATLNIILKRYPKAEGIVLDLRQNGGGSVENVWNILALMPARHDHLYTTQIKSGPAHDAFSEAERVYSSFDNGDYEPYRKTVVVLTDRGSYSATSFFALCTKAYDNMITLGDTTGGGLGLPSGGELPNGWLYRFPVTRTIAPDGRNYENGVPPDSVVMLEAAATAAGRDNVIETAAEIILKVEP